MDNQFNTVYVEENIICLAVPNSISLNQFSVPFFVKISKFFLFLVSHTTDDMIFQWDPEVPLVVDDNIELPQLAMERNYTADCKYLHMNSS